MSEKKTKKATKRSSSGSAKEQDKAPKNGRELLGHLQRQGPLAPVYYLYGEDPYLLRELLEAFDQYVEPAMADFNRDLLNGGEVPEGKLASTVRQLPMMASLRLVVVREANQLPAKEWDSLVTYLEDPSPTTCLVLTAPSKLDGRTKAGKLLQQIPCFKPYDNELPGWIRVQGRKLGLLIDQRGIERLLELIGSDLPSLHNALERLSLYVGGEGQIRREVVDEVIAETRSYDAFEMARVVGHRDIDGGLRMLRGLLEGGEAPLKILGLLAYNFRQLLRARVAVDQGTPALRVAEEFVHKRIQYRRERLLREFAGRLEQFSQDELKGVLLLLHQTDLALKSSSGLPDHLLMEKLILDLCQLRS
jgi:DNA polymerase III subunit delta